MSTGVDIGPALLLASICAFCAHMKRWLLCAHARREGYDVMALGQRDENPVIFKKSHRCFIKIITMEKNVIG